MSQQASLCIEREGRHAAEQIYLATCNLLQAFNLSWSGTIFYSFVIYILIPMRQNSLEQTKIYIFSLASFFSKYENFIKKAIISHPTHV